MKIHRAYRTELRPNNRQITMLLRHVGTARFAYNWGLQKKQEVHDMNQLPVPHIKYPTAIDLHKVLVLLKKTEFQWMYEVSKCAPQEALRDLDKSFVNFFQKKTGFPCFKSRKDGVGSFRLTGHITVSDRYIKLPRIGKVRLKETNYLPTDKHVLSATVSQRAGRWFVSVATEEEIEVPTSTGPIAGVDLGINHLAVVSDGTIISNPKALNHYSRKLKRVQREVSRRKKVLEKISIDLRYTIW